MYHKNLITLIQKLWALTMYTDVNVVNVIYFSLYYIWQFAYHSRL